MTGSAKEFSRLLTEAIRLLKSQEDKSIAAIQDELGYAIGRTGATVEHWRKGNLPARPDQTEAFVQALCERTDLDRAWYKRFLITAGHANPEKFLATLIFGANPAQPAAVAQTVVTAAPEPEAPFWPLVPPEQPPEVARLVGRQKTLLQLKGQLVTAQLVVITGMPGVGKTALAAALLQWLQWPTEKLFWYPFRGREGINDIVWRLADFLAWHGLPEFQRLLRNNQPPPATVLLDALFHAMRNQGYLLCFDDFHLLDDLGAAEHLLRSFEARATRRELHIVLISRTIPKVVQTTGIETVTGLSREEANNLLRQQGIPVTEERMIDIQLLTQGNPQLLLLIGDMLKHGGDPNLLLTSILRSVSVENYVLREVDERISAEERIVMQTVAVLTEAAANVEIIEVVAAIGGVKKHLLHLAERHLVLCDRRGAEPIYSQHALVQTFYYEMLSRSERRTLHRRAADYYLHERHDPLHAALHLERASEYEQAVRVIAHAPLPQLLRQGRVQTVTQLLEKLAAEYGDSWQDQQNWLLLSIIRGHIYRLLGVYQRTLEMFEAALHQSGSPLNQAKLLTELGATYSAKGQFVEAKQLYLQSLALYQSLADDSQLAELHNGIGWAAYRLGHLTEAYTHFQQGQHFAHKHNQEQLIARIEQGLGLIQWRRGELAAAEATFTASRHRFAQLGESWHEAESVSNLGLVFDETGDVQRARQQWEQAIEMMEKIGKINSLITTYCNLGDSYQATGEGRTAIGYYTTALQLVENTDDTLMLSYTLARLADAQLTLGKQQEALLTATRAYQIAKAGVYQAELGSICRVLGDIWAALTDFNQAQCYYQQALPLLEVTQEIDELTKARQRYEQLSTSIRRPKP